MFRSDNGGDVGTWKARVRNTDTDTQDTLLLHNAVLARLEACGFSDSSDFLPMGWYVNTIAVDPVSPEIVWAAGVDWFRSSDGGQSWGPTSFWWAGDAAPASSFLHADQHRMVFHPTYDGAGNQTLFVANDGGVWRTDNGRAPVSIAAEATCDPANSEVAWRSLNNGYEVTHFYHGLPFPGGKAFLGGTPDNGTRMRRPHSGLNGWQSLFGGDGGYVAVDPRNTSVLYVESQNGNLQKSIDGGATFEATAIDLRVKDLIPAGAAVRGAEDAGARSRVQGIAVGGREHQVVDEPEVLAAGRSQHRPVLPRIGGTENAAVA